MATMPVIHLDKPLANVSILHAADGNSHSIHTDGDNSTVLQQAEQQKQVYENLCTALTEVVNRLNNLHADIFAGHSEAIARLSVEIARKVLMRNIRDGDYEIESIIQEALKNAPDNTPLIVRLNPKDLETFRKLKDSSQTVLSGFELQADPSVEPAECIVESSKGIIQLLIDEHLERISEALAKTG